MVLANSEGTLDEFFRGEARAIFYHVIPTLPRYKKGDRVGQIKLGISIPLEFEFVDEINEISAIDTTYSDFVGTDGITDGDNGLVPAPITSDVDKYLLDENLLATIL